MRIASLHRYPVKGLSPESLSRVVLEEGAYFPGDRLYAIENGPSGFDPDEPQHQPKIRFLQLMKNEALARLETRYDDASGVLSIRDGGKPLAEGALGTEEGRLAIAAALEAFLPAAERRGALRLLAAPHGFRFTDSRTGFVSLINRASVQALEERLGRPVDPLRFRGNLLVDGLGPWEEFSLVGRSLEGPSGVRLSVTKRIDRCAATAVEPGTGLRDLPIVRTLMEAWGHVDCGVYAQITHGGVLAEGQRLQETQQAEPVGLGLR